MSKPHVLKNGTRVHLVPMPGTEAMTALVLYKVGSRHENDKVWGGSHFLEHLMFKGTKRRPTTLELTKLIDQYGAEYNAYTGKDLTGYYIKIDSSKAGVALDVLSDMLLNSLFAPKEMVRERKVIIEEIKMYEENPIMHVEDLLEEAMFDGHVLGRNIAGTAATMMSMRRDDLLRYKATHYIPAQTVIILAGKVPKSALSLLNKTFGGIADRPVPAAPGAFTPYDRLEPVIRRQYKKVEQVQLAFGYPTVGRGHDDQEAIRLLAMILGGSMSSRLFIEVRERRGLCYSIRASTDSYEDVGVFQIRAGLDAARLGEASKVILREVQKIARAGVTDEELQKAKDHVRGAMTLRLEDCAERAEFVGRQELFLGQVMSPEAKMKRYERVTKADVRRAAREILRREQLSVAVVGPFKSDKELKRVLGL